MPGSAILKISSAGRTAPGAAMSCVANS